MRIGSRASTAPGCGPPACAERSSQVGPLRGRQHLYVRHKPEETRLYPVIEQHAHRFFAELREQGASLPSFVQAEFDHYLHCGRLEGGFLRVKCSQCRHERLVAFSCKCRGFLSVMRCAAHGRDRRASGRPCLPARTLFVGRCRPRRLPREAEPRFAALGFSSSGNSISRGGGCCARRLLLLAEGSFICTPFVPRSAATGSNGGC